MKKEIICRVWIEGAMEGVLPAAEHKEPKMYRGHEVFPVRASKMVPDPIGFRLGKCLNSCYR